MIAVPINHISIDERGVAYITGTRIKVSHLVVERNVWQKSPEAIQQDFPQLSLGDIYAAMVYYCDNLEQIDSEIADEERFESDMRGRQQPSVTRESLISRLRPTGNSDSTG